MIVNVQRHEDVAVITMESPPVNALGLALRSGLLDALAGLRGEAGLRAIVLAGTARAFSGGADITEFGKPPTEPNLRVVIAAIEDMDVPVVAAIQGVALGGGLELALGCHARVVWASAKLGLPEVKLGILPGAGGTQRLPRIVGVEKALAMIVTGTPIGGTEAATIGLADALLEGAYPDAAVAWARQGVEKRRVRDRDEKLQPARDDPGLIDRVAAPLLKASGAASPRACVESVRNAVTLPFDQGQAGERALFEKLVAGDESRAQRHAFFAEREAQKVKLPEGTKARRIERAAVIGAGTMGGGIAMCFANAGIPVTVIETEQAALDRGLGRIGDLYQGSAKRGSITAEQAEQRRALIEGALDVEGVREADIIVEAVFEEMSVKKDVFAKLDRLAKPGAILATNTSYLDIDEIAASTSRPGDVIGMHFFSPANVMRLLEIVRGKATSPETIATASEVGQAAGQGQHRGRQLLRLRRQPDAVQADGSGGTAAAGWGQPGGGRSCPDGFWVQDGPVRHVGSRRLGHRHADPQGVSARWRRSPTPSPRPGATARRPVPVTTSTRAVPRRRTRRSMRSSRSRRPSWASRAARSVRRRSSSGWYTR